MTDQLQKSLESQLIVYWGAIAHEPVAELDKKSRGGRSSIEHEQRLCFDYEKMLIHTVF